MVRFISVFGKEYMTIGEITQDYDVYRNGPRVEVRGRISGEVVRAEANAAAAIQRALDLASEQGGGTVTLQPGTYLLSRAIRLPSRVTLRGSSRATVLRLAPENESGIVLLGEEADGVAVADLTLDGDHDACPASTAGVVLDHCGDCRLSGVNAARFGQYGIWARNNCFLCTVDGCTAADNAAANIFFDRQQNGGRGGDYVPNLIIGCTCYGGGTGIEVHRSIVLNVIGCQVFQPNWHAYHIHGRSNSVLVSGCRSFQCEQNAVLVEHSHEINLSSNIFCWHRGHGIELVGVQWGTVTGNNVIDQGVRDREGQPKDGIWLRGGCRGLQVTGNAVFNWGDQIPMRIGILEEDDCYKNVINGNNINYCVEDGVLAQGDESVVTANVSHLPEAYEGPPHEPIPDFTTDRLQQFIRALNEVRS